MNEIFIRFFFAFFAIITVPSVFTNRSFFDSNVTFFMVKRVHVCVCIRTLVNSRNFFQNLPSIYLYYIFIQIHFRSRKIRH